MKITSIKVLSKGFLLMLCLSMTSLAYAEPPAFIPEFAGGVQDSAIWHDASFFTNANQCSMQYKCGMLSKEPAKKKLCEAQVKSCVAKYMSKQGASPQAIAFARYSEIPGMIDQIKRYNKVDVVHANMEWADASEGFFIITKSGFIVPAFNNFGDIEKGTDFQNFKKQNPRAMLWGLPNGWPVVQTPAAGGEQVVFSYLVKNGCHACGNIASADVAYNFDSNGKYLNTQLVKITSMKQ